jgi:hypothetical protein
MSRLWVWVQGDGGLKFRAQEFGVYGLGPGAALPWSRGGQTMFRAWSLGFELGVYVSGIRFQ